METARNATLVKDKKTFQTVEDYLEFLCQEKILDRIKPKQNYFNGILKITQNDVLAGLDWSRVIVDKAIVDNGMVKEYSSLPKTRTGVMTNLIPQTFEQYMEHNYFASKDKNGYFDVDIFRIHQQQFDYSKVRADVALCYAPKINLSNLPYAHKIYGLSLDNLIIDCNDAYKVAKEKGVNQDILKQLKPKNKLLQKMMSLFDWSKN